MKAEGTARIRPSCLRGHITHDDHRRSTSATRTNRPSPTDPALRVGIALLSSCVCSCLREPGVVRGWLFLFVMLWHRSLVSLYLRRVNPDVIAGRINRHERTETLGSALGVDLLPADDAGDPDCGSPGRWAVPLVPRAVVGLRAGLCPDDHGDRGRDLGRVREQVLRADPSASRPTVVTRSSTPVLMPSSDIRVTLFSYPFFLGACPWLWVPCGL